MKEPTSTGRDWEGRKGRAREGRREGRGPTSKARGGNGGIKGEDGKGVKGSRRVKGEGRVSHPQKNLKTKFLPCMRPRFY